MDTTNNKHKPISLFTKIVYGSGELGLAHQDSFPALQKKGPDPVSK